MWSVNKECMLFLLDSTLNNSILFSYISLNRSVKSVTKSQVISDKVQQLDDYVILWWYYC